MGQALPTCSVTGHIPDKRCCRGSRGAPWPNRDVFYENYDMGATIRNSPIGYTCLVFPRKGGAKKQVCEMTVRNLHNTLYESRINTCDMYKECLLDLRHDGI